ncbi:hypothetical protein ACRAR1_09230 [Streptomyces sanyensis]|uniref:hypothetical protein n=1 Tax=Streptomyces sanyensis TaxID=568869 RepID=UPI003D778E7D
MISIKTSTATMTDHSVVSRCMLGFSSAFQGTGLSGAPAMIPAFRLGGLAVLERNERPTKALEAGVAAAEAPAYALAAASATQQTTHHHSKWAFRGLEPWSDPA